MNIRLLRRPHLYSPLLTLALLAVASAHAELRAPLTPEERTNGRNTSDALADLRASAAAATAKIVDMKGALVVTGTWVGEDGYLLTKASEVLQMDQVRVQQTDGSLVQLREVRRDSAHDLVLAQAFNLHGVQAAQFVPSQSLKFGQWLASPAQGEAQLCIGVLSAQRRKIPGMGAAIGVRMDQKAPGGKGGVRILGIAEDSPAAMAGLQKGDVLLELGGERIAKHQRVQEIIAGHQPGEQLEVRYRRNGKEGRATVRLASRTKILANWEGEDFANGGISIRTDNFAQVLQHDLPLSPRDMGAPLLDLEGHVIGVNIARVDRVTTFALPSELFWPTVSQWMEQDRHPPKAVVPATVASSIRQEPLGQPESQHLVR